MNRAAARVVLVVLAGCGTTLTTGSARTLAPGDMQWSAALGVNGAGVGGGDTTPVLPLIEAGVRRGIVPGLELGAKLFAAGAEVDTKIELHRAERTGFSVSLDPIVGYMPLLAPVWTVELPVLLGYTFRNGAELVFGPRLIARVGRFDMARFDLEYGNTLGIAIPLGRRWTMMPEVSSSSSLLTSLYAVGGGVGFIRNF